MFVSVQESLPYVFPHLTHTHTHTYIYMLIVLTFLRTWKWLKIGRNVVFYPWFLLCYSIKTWNLQFMGFPEQLLQLRIFTIWMAKNDFHRHFNHNWIKLELNCQLKINVPLKFRHVRILFVSLFFNNTWGEQSVSAKRYVLKPGTPEHPGTLRNTPLTTLSKCPSAPPRKTLRFSGNKINRFPRKQSLTFYSFCLFYFGVFRVLLPLGEPKVFLRALDSKDEHQVSSLTGKRL